MKNPTWVAVEAVLDLLGVGDGADDPYANWPYQIKRLHLF